jgi:hypothetical protein
VDEQVNEQATPSQQPRSRYVLNAGGWRITLEWVGDETSDRAPEPRGSSEPTITPQDLAQLRRRMGLPIVQTRTIERNLEAGEHRELHAFKDGDSWRIPVSGLRRHLKEFGARLPVVYERNLKRWGSLVQPPHGSRPTPPPRRSAAGNVAEQS